jgi:hypothetical protein
VIALALFGVNVFSTLIIGTVLAGAGYGGSLVLRSLSKKMKDLLV